MLRTIERRGDEDAIARIADTECEVVDGRAAPSREDHLLGQDGLVRLEVSVEDIVGKMAAKKSGTGGTLAISKKLIGFWFRQRHTHDTRKKGLEKEKKKRDKVFSQLLSTTSAAKWAASFFFTLL